MERSVSTAWMRNGDHNPQVTAANPPTSGPASAPTCCTPNICVTCLPRCCTAPVSAMTVMRLCIHICVPTPAMNRYTSNSLNEPEYAALAMRSEDTATISGPASRIQRRPIRSMSMPVGSEATSVPRR